MLGGIWPYQVLWGLFDCAGIAEIVFCLTKGLFLLRHTEALCRKWLLSNRGKGGTFTCTGHFPQKYFFFLTLDFLLADVNTKST